VKVNGETVQNVILRYTNIYDADHPASEPASAPPATGDSTPLMLCMALMALSILGAVWAVKRSKKA